MLDGGFEPVEASEPALTVTVADLAILDSDVDQLDLGAPSRQDGYRFGIRATT